MEIFIMILLIALVIGLVIHVDGMYKNIQEIRWHGAGYEKPNAAGEYLVQVQFADGVTPDKLAIAAFDGEVFVLNEEGAYVAAWMEEPEMIEIGL